MKNILCLLTVIIVITGCATVGRKIDQAKVAQIKQGQTTRAQVVQLIGSPDQMTQMGNGTVMFQYVYVRASAKASNFVPVVNMFAGGMDMQNESVMVTFTNDVVSQIVSTSGGNEINSGVAAGGSADLPATTSNKRPR